MNGDQRQARRYHWHSGDVSDFVDAPHSAIDGPTKGEIIYLADSRRTMMCDLPTYSSGVCVARWQQPSKMVHAIFLSHC